MIKEIDWDKLFEQNSKRYFKVYDDNDKLIEVHDKENGNVWTRIDGNRWMYMGQ